MFCGVTGGTCTGGNGQGGRSYAHVCNRKPNHGGSHICVTCREPFN